MASLADFNDFTNNDEFLDLVQIMSSTDGRAKSYLYVEAPYDVGCWNRILELLNVSEYFEVSPYGQAHGRKQLLALLNEEKLHKRQMIAIDADLDRLVNHKVEKFQNPFVFDTYVYSIEGVILHRDVIHGFVKIITKDFNFPDINFMDFIDQYSQFCYQELSRIVRHFDAECGDEGPDNLREHFMQCCLSEDIIKKFLNNEESIVDAMGVDTELISSTCEVLQDKGIHANDAYQYIRGHALKGVVDLFVKNLLSIIRSMNDESIREEYKNERDKISEKIKAFSNRMSGYNLEMYLRTASYPLDAEPLSKIAQKINSTVQSYILN